MPAKKDQAAKPKQEVNKETSVQTEEKKDLLTQIEVSVAPPDLNVGVFATVQIISQ